uniref:P-type ATPase A domain-containing protein n=1 Tax=Pseudonaja textilis TaxID=8673 RepID=A0A670Z528_PSETE
MVWIAERPTLCPPQGSSTVESRHLVPGDLLLLEGQRFSLPCDAILLEGSCVVNEGLLTGESVPVSKTPLPHSDNTLPWKAYGRGDHQRHVLFCGTEVIQTRRAGPGPVRAVVLQTGECRTSCLAQPASDTVAMALLLLTVPVPPVIPAALTTSIVYAQRRLARKRIFCISPQRINLCGQINLVCFDKVGRGAGVVQGTGTAPPVRKAPPPPRSCVSTHKWKYSSTFNRGQAYV